MCHIDVVAQATFATPFSPCILLYPFEINAKFGGYMICSRSRLFRQLAPQRLRIEHKFVRTGTHMHNCPFATVKLQEDQRTFVSSAKSRCAQPNHQFRTMTASTIHQLLAAKGNGSAGIQGRRSPHSLNTYKQGQPTASSPLSHTVMYQVLHQNIACRGLPIHACISLPLFPRFQFVVDDSIPELFNVPGLESLLTVERFA